MKKTLVLCLLSSISLSSCQKGNPNKDGIITIYIDFKTSVSGIKDELHGPSNFQLDLAKRIQGVNSKYSFTDDRSRADLFVTVNETYGNAAGKITYEAMIVIARKSGDTIYQGKASDPDNALGGQNKAKERIAEVINRELQKAVP
jgi:hypothetical protein